MPCNEIISHNWTATEIYMSNQVINLSWHLHCQIGWYYEWLCEYYQYKDISKPTQPKGPTTGKSYFSHTLQPMKREVNPIIRKRCHSHLNQYVLIGFDCCVKPLNLCMSQPAAHAKLQLCLCTFFNSLIFKILNLFLLKTIKDLV